MTDREFQSLPAAAAQNSICGVLSLLFIASLLLVGKLLPAKIEAPPPVAVLAAYRNLALSARAAYVLDGTDGKELYGFNTDSQLPLASLTKIMTAVTALSLAPEDTIIAVKPDYLLTEGDSGLFANENWKLKDLLDLTLVESSNDGANAVAAVVGALGKDNPPYNFGQEQFVAAMNKKAGELGLKETYFLNPTGLDENFYASGGYGSVRDISELFLHAIKKYPTIFEVTRYETGQFSSLDSLKHNVRNTNAFVGKVPSLLASKTGFTDLAGGNLTIAFDAGPNHPIVVSVLGSTENGRFEDAEKLVFATLEYLSQSR